MATYTQTTELEAVNSILLALGDSPVNTIVDTGLLYVDTAVELLHKHNRGLQAEGCSFNTEVEYPLVPDVNGEINLPSNTLRIWADTFSTGESVIQRGSKLYNKKTHSSVFANPATITLALFLPFTDITEPARAYITILAAKEAQAKLLGSQTLDALTAREEQQARFRFMDDELENKKLNVFTGSNSGIALHRRR